MMYELSLANYRSSCRWTSNVVVLLRILLPGLRTVHESVAFFPPAGCRSREEEVKLHTRNLSGVSTASPSIEEDEEDYSAHAESATMRSRATAGGERTAARSTGASARR
ncbi:hypothetical protein PR202_gb17360 [Eleusine coracana subsp. coracana]|uniref:Uncharacterized protein n=1 Tax=Eleusine coracana subsp. coracana TaxID=191504 RepID=A0AAV5F2Q7_ELECO|nr:hypothetical protein PR202_gb17360 [Eleusine coracana subsp. coracana]